MRYAAYLRVSSEEQVGNYSIEAQRRANITWVKAQEGVLAKTYIDEAESGRKADRPGFQEMRRDARKLRFDAVVVHKFDRFARNRTDALAIKSLLRYDYGIKVLSVTEPSEDSDGPIGALIEGIMESVAEWYSRNLGAEVRKGVKERHNQGIHNRQPPFGYHRGEDKKALVVNAEEAEGVRLAFNAYATGEYSYTTVADLLNEHGYRSTSGCLFSRYTVREILRNRIYLGEVRYQETRWNTDGTRSFDAPVEWNDGNHNAIIEQDLWDKIEAMRGKRRSHRQDTKSYNSYLLRGLVYCYSCCSHPLDEADFPSWGKMYCRTHSGHGVSYYYCSASQRAGTCGQKSVPVDIIDKQVVSALMSLKPPKNWRDNVVEAISEAIGAQDLEQRLEQIRDTIKRMDFRWDNGFITDKVDYM